jgi:hypothetical protein
MGDDCDKMNATSGKKHSNAYKKYCDQRREACPRKMSGWLSGITQEDGLHCCVTCDYYTEKDLKTEIAAFLCQERVLQI